MMKELAAWWKDRSGASRLALISLGLLFVSQFFTYYDNAPNNRGQLFIHADFSTTGYYYTDTNAIHGGTGWHIHPWAPGVLLLLAALHGSSIRASRSFLRFGFWLSLPVFFVALPPAAITTPGAKMGFLALGLMLIAAIWNQRKSLPSPPAKPATT